MTMKLRFYALANAPFEAARRVSILPEGHRSSRTHGHSFLARVRLRSGLENAADDDGIGSALTDAVTPLNYSLLNEHIDVPTDENIARFVRARIVSSKTVDVVGIQSTRDQGVDLDADDVAHIWRRFRFEAAHQLPNVPAGHQCGRMHGHGFEVVIHARESLARRDMGVDFDYLEELWRPLHATLDYSCLNDIGGLENPTSELIAKWIWDRLCAKFDGLSWVTVYETTTAGCHYDGRNYRIWKQFSFESALARLDLDPSDPRYRLHGHSFVTRLHLTCDLDKAMGWTIDYGDIKERFRRTYAQLDHHPVHEITAAVTPNGNSLLDWMRRQLHDSLPQMDGIDLFETPSRGASLCWGRTGRPPLPA